MRVFRSGDGLAVTLSTKVEVQVEGGALTVNRSREAALATPRSLARPLPEGYTFDRAEANRR